MSGRVQRDDRHAGPVLQQASARFTVETGGPGFIDLTAAIVAFVQDARIAAGLATLFCRHTSASLLVGENTDPDVGRDLADALDRLAPRTVAYRHADEGPDDMPAHIRAALTGASVSIPVVHGRLALGTWQAIFLAEHRDRPHRREVLAHLVGA